MTEQAFATERLKLTSDTDMNRKESNNSKKALNIAAASWATIAVLGQILFASYVTIVFGVNALSSDIKNWGAHLPTGYIPGNTIHNASLISHLLIAVLIMLAGGIQLLPKVRQTLPKLHRWSGRVYITGAFTGAIGGLIIVWYTKGSVGDMPQHLGITLDAILIFIFAAFAWQTALKRRFNEHRRWALRLFIVTNAVWFFRLGLPLWLMINQGPAGFDPKTFTGPFLSILSFADYLVPLLILEIYFWGQQQQKSSIRYGITALLSIAILLTIAGLFGAINILWLPQIMS